MHGWKGTAQPADHNVRSFRAQLNAVRKRTYSTSGRKITGVYLTWNSSHLPGLAEYPAYFLTRARADRIAKGGGIANAIAALANAAREHSGEHFIVAGHSFGGRILGRVVGERPKILRNVDLVLLANAADDAEVCYKTVAAVHKEPYQRRQLPKLVWVTSGKDGMTGPLYRLAGWKTAVGHERLLQSHRVSLVEPTELRPHYGAKFEKTFGRRSPYAHNVLIARGLGGHGDVWNEAMVAIVNYYLLHNR